ncbi:altered inheritance of mitochondria 32 [Olea europaea subsp. europaea]|uniref:Altered inheritance of mitochondria 32 n=1 Tax=Olea europaea subsp. europaea TaxID=158383 RepID=A0A8S0S5S8_OLEEU|nr:altered inheritance of mitochondria 32 [Olea europaea subsp. europaea]
MKAPSTDSSGQIYTRATSLAPLILTTATCSFATRLTTHGLLALRILIPIRFPSSSPPLLKLAKTTSLLRGLKDSDVDGFVDDVVVNGKPWASGVQEALSGTYVFVCAHNNRDRRCGVCGPVLIKKFKEDIESKGLQDQVVVTACSHVGGHKYAGNVIIFSADAEGKISGNWYGYVTPNDVSELTDRQIGKGEIIERIWRGRMGTPVKKTEKVEEPKLTNGTNLNNNEKQPQESGTEDKESVGSCCQGVNGFSCCRDENFEKPVKKGSGGLSCWTGKWEQWEILTAVAVVGAVASIAMTYGLHRRSR